MKKAWQTIRCIFNPIQEEDFEIVECKCGLMATYRCGINSPKSDLKESHPELTSYWYGSSIGQYSSIWHHRYRACDKCIGDLKATFNHHPDGWKEHYKCHTDFEPPIIELKQK